MALLSAILSPDGRLIGFAVQKVLLWGPWDSSLGEFCLTLEKLYP
jgi:hypothetical protein